MDAQSGTGGFANGLNTLFVSGGEIHQGSGGLCRLIGRFLNSGDKKSQPSLPIARKPHGLQQVIVLLAMLLEIEAEIQQRLVQRTLGTKEECDQQPAKSSIAIEKRMDGFKLDVCQSREKGRFSGAPTALMAGFRGGGTGFPCPGPAETPEAEFRQV